MCNTPINQIDRSTGELRTFACGKCKECLAARINDWVARGVAEKAMSGETLVIRLSYRDNPDGTKPQGAVAFDYADVQVFLKRLREQYYEKYQKRGEIRYLCCGERGERKSRVHYHIVLFSRKPISVLGTWENAYDAKKKGFVANKDLLWKTKGGYMWDHGHVHCQVPDQGGIYYALKYAFADQFNSVKSKGTARFEKSTDNSASHFRQSRKPPIGFSWLESKVNGWEKRLIVPPTLDLKPPEYKGFWYPTGKFREYLLTRLHYINQKCREELGRDAAAWDTLLLSAQSRETDLEMLEHGEIVQTETLESSVNKEVARKQALRATRQFIEKRETAIKERCGHLAVCSTCWARADRQRADEISAYYEAQRAEWNASQTKQPLDEWWQSRNGCNPFCDFQHTKERKRIFKAGK